MAKKSDRVRMPSGMDIQKLMSLKQIGSEAEKDFKKEQSDLLTDVTQTAPPADPNDIKDTPIEPTVTVTKEAKGEIIITDVPKIEVQKEVPVQDPADSQTQETPEPIEKEKETAFGKFNLKKTKPEPEPEKKGLWILKDFMGEYTKAPNDKRESAHLYNTNGNAIKKIAMIYNDVNPPVNSKDKTTAESLLNNIVSGWLFEHEDEITKLLKKGMQL